MYKYISQDKTISANLPTTIEELVKALPKLTSHIDLDNHYCIVALCYKAPISGIASNIDSGVNSDIVDVVPVLAKLSPNEDGYLKNHLYHRVVIDRTSIERGVHCANRSVLNYEKIIGKVRDESIKLYMNNKNNADFKNQMQNQSCYFVEFKLVPVNFINAVYNEDDYVDPFACVE